MTYFCRSSSSEEASVDGKNHLSLNVRINASPDLGLTIMGISVPTGSSASCLYARIGRGPSCAGSWSKPTMVPLVRIQWFNRFRHRVSLMTRQTNNGAAKQSGTMLPVSIFLSRTSRSVTRGSALTAPPCSIFDFWLHQQRHLCVSSNFIA